MSSPQFTAHFERYLAEARTARAEDKHHDHRRGLFLNFLHDAFGIDLSEVEQEQYIQLQGQRVQMHGTARVRKGWIDAVFRDLLFEFKRDLRKEEADGLRELRDYLSNMANGAECVGLLTDGLSFTAYVLDAGMPAGLKRVDALDLEKASPQVAYLWLDAYLLSQKGQVPTSEDIVRRFGLTSPTFVAAARVLRAALATFDASEAGASEVKRQQWAFHLARVYGSADARNDEMFVRHTYLCQFAKILAYAAYFGVGKAADEIEGVINGKAFEVLGVGNIGEQDFFAWVLAPEVVVQTRDVFHHIAASLAVYDLKRIDEDLLKQLYQNLVEPETRHELGEFYTPDWLAELTLRQIEYGPKKSLLDPACGSGTFLFTALRLLAEQGLQGDALVDFALENVMGIDVHPLAVTIARINYMLAILPHLQSSTQRRERAIPVAMANSFQVPSKAGPVSVIEIKFDGQRDFRIPTEAARRPQELARVLAEMQRRAEQIAPAYPNIKGEQFGKYALEALPAGDSWTELEFVKATWDQNLRDLTEQIARGRDSIWVYVLQNTSQPLILQHRKFDVIAGNPPWIAFRYLQDESYRNDVKTLTRDYGLLASSDVKLNTQMELSTVFYEHCYRAYLKLGGTIAMVMPRSVLTGAKQHQAFQRKGFSRILDLKGVAPLFNVETCVVIREGGTLLTEAIPTRRYAGALPGQECSYAAAKLEETESTTTFGEVSEVASPYYHPRFKQGATLVPRNLVFVTSAQPDLQPGQIAHSSIMRTDPDVDAEAKAPWKGLTLEGYIDDTFLYATLLSKNLVPFGVRRLHLVALPITVGVPSRLAEMPGQAREDRFLPMSLDAMRASIKYGRSADEWFARAEKLWAENKSPTTKETLAEWLNYQNKITAQSAEPGYVVMYGASGSNISAAVMDANELPTTNGATPSALVAESGVYWFRANTRDEAFFLGAILNAPCVDAAIKTHQPRGVYVGPRHIHRRPFEVCPIPEFNPGNADHLRLAALSQRAHAAVAALDLREGGVVATRKKAREAARDAIREIDEIARRLLGLPASETVADVIAETDDDEESDEDPDSSGK